MFGNTSAIFSDTSAGSEATDEEEQALAILMDDPVYRAHVIAHFSLAPSVALQSYVQLGGKACPGCGNYHPPDELIENLIRIDDGSAAFGRELVPLIMAVDGDYSIDELSERFGELALHSFTIRYRQQDLQADSRTNHHGHYLMRSTHVRHPPPSPFDLDTLQQGGYDVDIVKSLLPTSQLTPALLSGDVLPLITTGGRTRIGVLDLAMAMDFMLEAGILVPGSSQQLIAESLQKGQHDFVALETNRLQHLPVSVKQTLFHATGQKDALAALAIELGLEVESADFANHLKTIEDMVNHSQNPASLFQIVQLSRLGFTLEEISGLSYDARDAIIISDPENKDDFIAKLKTSLSISTFDAAKINTITHVRGALVFILLNKGYTLKDIQPHNSDMYKLFAW